VKKFPPKTLISRRTPEEADAGHPGLIDISLQYPFAEELKLPTDNLSRYTNEQNSEVNLLS